MCLCLFSDCVFVCVVVGWLYTEMTSANAGHTVDHDGLLPSAFVVCPKQVRSAILDALDSAVEKDPINRDRINSVLHQFELSFKHKTSNFGLNLMYDDDMNSIPICVVFPPCGLPGSRDFSSHRCIEFTRLVDA